MKALKIILLIIGIFIALFLVVTIFLPSKYTVTRSVEIKSSASVPFELVNNMRNWEKWSPWYEMDKNMKITYSGPESGVGAAYSWESKDRDLGAGKIENLKVNPNKIIIQHMTFIGTEGGDETFTFDEVNGVTKVIWTMTGEMGFFTKWFGLMLDKMMGKTFDKGLANIKKISEECPVVNIVITDSTVTEQDILYITDSTSHDNMKLISDLFAKAYGEIGKYMHKNKLEMAGAPIGITKDFKLNYVFDAAIPVKSVSKTKPEGRIKIMKSYSGKVAKGIYTGSYDGLEAAYAKLMNYMKEKNLEVNGYPWEEYVSDPGNTPKDKLVTILYFPVK